jgi:hypothetical protein
MQQLPIGLLRSFARMRVRQTTFGMKKIDGHMKAPAAQMIASVTFIAILMTIGVDHGTARRNLGLLKTKANQPGAILFR